MKKTFYAVAILSVISCSQVEEKINQSIETTTNSIKEKAKAQVEETVGATINESINKLVNAEDIAFQQVFPSIDTKLLTDYKGKKVNLPNGSSVILMKYKSNADQLLPLLEKEATTDETKSDKVATKIDGQTFRDKFSLVEKFLPENIVNTFFTEELKTNDNLQFYRLTRFPNKSTIIVNPESQLIYQIVELK